MKKLAVLAVAGLLSVTASASNWALINSNSDTDTYVDVESISTSGNYRTTFVKTYEHQYRLQPQSTSETYNEMTLFYKYDCSSNPKKAKLLSLQVMKDSEYVFSSDKLNRDWKIAYPDTISEKIANLVCSY